MTELPKICWYVELPKNKDEIDLIKLRHALGANYSFYTDSGRNYEFYYIGSNGLSDCTHNFDHVDGLENLTHLFLKKKEGKMEVIEIAGKKYRKVNSNCELENGDLVLHDNLIHTFVGYHIGYSVLAKQDGSFVSSNFNFHFKLEEIKTRTLHYAIYKNERKDICHSSFYESEEKLKEHRPDALEYRTYEEQL